MLEGSFQHEDFCGHRGTIQSGDLQWMTAGRGIMHSEMPAGDGENIGLQLWINLKAKDKVCSVYQPLYHSTGCRTGSDLCVIWINGTVVSFIILDGGTTVPGTSQKRHPSCQ